MKRDFDMIRELLLVYDSADLARIKEWADKVVDVLHGGRGPEIVYHLGLITEAGYITPSAPLGYQLTPAGLALLDKIRDPKVWSWMKATCESSEVPLFSGSIDALHEKLQRSGGVLA